MKKISEEIQKGFEPVFNSESRILILGSFPSAVSRQEGFYYGNKQNRFWKTLANIFNEEIGIDKKSKLEFLFKHSIALWDIIMTCDTIGSSDNKIKNPVLVDLDIILKHAQIEKIILNGKKSLTEFEKRYKNINIKYVCLSSTSPANVKFNISEWKRELLNI